MNEMRKLMEAVQLDEDNYEISPAIKKYFAEQGMYVKVKSVWSGKISKAISVEPATRGQKYAIAPSKEWKKIIPILVQFAEERRLAAEVYESEYNGRIIIEYTV